MWAILYHFRQRGFRFRRQMNIGPYYVDFACLAPAVVIEVDGDTHAESTAQSNDAVRDDYLRGRGFRVLRFWNNDVMGNSDGVYSVIDEALTAASEHLAPPTPAPSPQGGGRHSGRGVAR
jgi:very-short-patch-repair endonuclease